MRDSCLSAHVANSGADAGRVGHGARSGNLAANLSHFWCVRDVAVHPDFRRQGIGRELLKKIELHATRTGCCRVTLEVRQDNKPAQELYQSLGFAPGEPMQEFWIKHLVRE